MFYTFYLCFQGQEIVAEQSLDLAAKEGHWVILQVNNLSWKIVAALGVWLATVSPSSQYRLLSYLACVQPPPPLDCLSSTQYHYSQDFRPVWTARCILSSTLTVISVYKETSVKDRAFWILVPCFPVWRFRSPSRTYISYIWNNLLIISLEPRDLRRISHALKSKSYG